MKYVSWNVNGLRAVVGKYFSIEDFNSYVSYLLSLHCYFCISTKNQPALLLNSFLLLS